MIEFCKRQYNRLRFVVVVAVALPKALWLQYKHGDEIQALIEEQEDCEECYPRTGLFCDEHTVAMTELGEKLQ